MRGVFGWLLIGAQNQGLPNLLDAADFAPRGESGAETPVRRWLFAASRLRALLLRNCGQFRFKVFPPSLSKAGSARRIFRSVWFQPNQKSFWPFKVWRLVTQACAARLASPRYDLGYLLFRAFGPTELGRPKGSEKKIAQVVAGRRHRAAQPESPNAKPLKGQKDFSFQLDTRPTGKPFWPIPPSKGKGEDFEPELATVS